VKGWGEEGGKGKRIPNTTPKAKEKEKNGRERQGL